MKWQDSTKVIITQKLHRIRNWEFQNMWNGMCTIEMIENLKIENSTKMWVCAISPYERFSHYRPKCIFEVMTESICHTFLLFSLYFSSFNRQYLKLVIMDISVFASKLFIYTLCFYSTSIRSYTRHEPKVRMLKTLFNIVEAPFKLFLNFDVCVVWWCSDEQINSQEYSSFEIYAVTIKIPTLYDWISPLNKWSGSPFIQTQQSMAKWVTFLSIFTSLKHLMVILRCNVFQGFILYTSLDQRHW